jgi:hypothetical protein
MFVYLDELAVGEMKEVKSRWQKRLGQMSVSGS